MFNIHWGMRPMSRTSIGSLRCVLGIDFLASTEKDEREESEPDDVVEARRLDLALADLEEAMMFLRKDILSVIAKVWKVVVKGRWL